MKFLFAVILAASPFVTLYASADEMGACGGRKSLDVPAMTFQVRMDGQSRLVPTAAYVSVEHEDWVTPQDAWENVKGYLVPIPLHFDAQTQTIRTEAVRIQFDMYFPTLWKIWKIPLIVSPKPCREKLGGITFQFNTRPYTVFIPFKDVPVPIQGQEFPRAKEYFSESKNFRGKDITWLDNSVQIIQPKPVDKAFGILRVSSGNPAKYTLETSDGKTLFIHWRSLLKPELACAMKALQEGWPVELYGGLFNYQEGDTFYVDDLSDSTLATCQNPAPSPKAQLLIDTEKLKSLLPAFPPN